LDVKGSLGARDAAPLPLAKAKGECGSFGFQSMRFCASRCHPSPSRFAFWNLEREAAGGDTRTVQEKAPKRPAMSLDSFFAACKYLSCVMCVVCMQWGSQFTEPGVGLRFVLFYSIFHRWGFWPASSISGVSLFNLRLPHYFSSIRVISTDNDIHCYSDPASL
jgi:hypothetical protein